MTLDLFGRTPAPRAIVPAAFGVAENLYRGGIVKRRDRRKLADAWRICRVTGKRGYRNETAAMAALASTQFGARVLHKAERQERRAYSCRHCGKWHLTSQDFQPRGRVA